MVSAASFLAIKQSNLATGKESRLMIEDTSLVHEYLRFSEMKDRTEDEEKRYRELMLDVDALITMRHGCIAEDFADKDRKPVIKRVHRELRSEFGDETGSKKLLIDRLVAAYSMALSYERLLHHLKYNIDAEGKLNYGGFMHNVMKEIRKGIESGNDQIIRLTQALRDLNSPRLTVKTKNAFFAQNQQFNQGATPSDLESDSLSVSNHAPHSRRKSKVARS